MLKKVLAEFIGTAVLVLFGCGAAVLAGDNVGQLGIAFAFGLAIVAMAYGIGPISGCHINPAVSLGVFLAGRMSLNDMVVYWIAQFLGALAGAAILYAIASGLPGYAVGEYGLGSNGFGDKYLGGYSLTAALIFEIVATFIFVTVILGSTQTKAPSAFAGLAIGLTLVLIHIVGIQVTGVSVNPARSFGPAILAQGLALQQLWLFIVAPLAGAAIAGLAFRTRMLEADGAVAAPEKAVEMTKEAADMGTR
ncbi:MAG TPA: aquaporin Z [Hyphomonadaceae bacterium]|nr:aquaporin Z [Hyphomonadaceae bacterium]